MNPLRELSNHGQSIWLDFITRPFIQEGKLKKLIDEDGLKGVTSNPTIFQKAISGGHPDYDKAIRSVSSDRGDLDAYESIAIADIQLACDAFSSVFKETKGKDGYVSLEVNPHLAPNTQGTLEEARRLWKAVNRPNLMIKIPATVPGLQAIEGAIEDGINVNITLIFSLERYKAVVNAWLSGLEKRAAKGQPVQPIASVASFFVSRVDSLIDKKLENTPFAALRGNAAIANARLAYAFFEETLKSPRYKTLEAKGAQPQRPLWASTSTKNPAYRDVIYVEELIGPLTVNTLPPQTLEAFRDHGNVRDTLHDLNPDPNTVFQDLSKAGIDIKAATDQLEQEGVKLFIDSFDELLKGIAEKRKQLVGVK